MATITAVAPRRTAPDPSRNIWQVPLFLLGVGVFISAWQGWLPIGMPDPAADFTRDLAALHIAYEKVTPDRDELKELLTKIAPTVDSFPEHAPDARFALGSGYVRLAELTPVPKEAQEYWTLAKQQFEQIDEKQLSDPADPPRLAFRQAKARAAVGLPPGTPPDKLRLVISQLGVPPLGEELGEAGRLRGELSLRLPQPDLLTARESLRGYLLATGIATPAESLARAKLILAEVHVRLKELEPARKCLQEIGDSAPPDVIAPAKALLAQVHMKEDNYPAAIRELEFVRALPGISQTLRMTSAYHLGVCKVNTREPVAAVALYEEAVKGEGAEAIAAVVKLAELYLKDSDPAKRIAAAELLSRAVHNVRNAKRFSNPFIFVNEVQDTFDLAISVLLTDGAYEAAVTAADSYAPIAVAGKHREKRAEALAAWAMALQKDGGDYKSKALAAAAEYEAQVELQSAVTAKADALRRVAAMQNLAGEPAKAVETLQRAVQLPDLPDTAAANVWLDLAYALIAANRAEEVWKVLNEVMARVGPVSTATRYKLAHLFSDARDPKSGAPQPGLVLLGRNLFEQIAKQAMPGPEEQEFHELALVELSHEFIKSEQYSDAQLWLQKQLQLYPNGPEAALGRLFLGISLQRQAMLPPPTGPEPATAARMREEAAKLFKQVVSEVDAKVAKGQKLGNRDAWLRLQAGLRLLQAYLQMGKPQDLNNLLAEAAPLLDRHRDTVEQLIVMSLVYHAFKQQNQPGRALEMRDQMKDLFKHLPPSAFTAPKGEYSRDYWETVWFSEKQ